jgi:phosphatidylserine synthase
VDPWHDYLAFPVAPLTLVVQMGALFVSRRPLRWILGILCPAAIVAMFAYVSSLPEREQEGVNLGAAVLLLWLLVSFVILAIAVVREVVTAVRRGGRVAEPS